MDPKGLIIVACGLFSICGAFFNWDWFMNHRKARFLSNFLGRSGARLLYGILGGALVVLGGAIASGSLK